MPKFGKCTDLLKILEKELTHLPVYNRYTVLDQPYSANCKELHDYVAQWHDEDRHWRRYSIKYDPLKPVQRITTNYDPYGENLYLYLDSLPREKDERDESN